jgi:Arc/MetJ-type ribon-helix-helix transcriptional regulator
MSEQGKDRRKKLIEDVETLVDDVGEAVRVAVISGSGATLSVGESLKETIQNVRAARDSVVMVRVNKESLEKLDELVEAGIVNSRSEAAAFLIVEGTKARQGLFDRISSKIEEIRNAKQELKKLLEEDEDPSSDPAVSE